MDFKKIKISLVFLILILVSGCSDIYVDVPAPTDINDHVEVALQDQTTATVILPMVQQLDADNLTINTIINSYNVTIDNTSGFAIGQHFRIINALADRYYFGTIINIVGNVIVLDTPLDYIYITGSEVTVSNINMAVDGSVTPVTFKLRTGTPSIPSDVDITRMIMTCQSTTPVSLNEFCDIPILTKGIVFRRVDGIVSNIFNIKSNADLAGITFDFTPYFATNPSQAVDGFVSRLTFAGQDKVGVVLRVDQTGNLEMIIQDDLTDLVSLIVVLEGHVVEN